MGINTMTPFDHDPTEIDSVSGADLESFEEARERAEQVDTHEAGIGFVTTRHDPYLVVEMSDVVSETGVYTKAAEIINALGWTFISSHHNSSTMQLIYEGELPEALSGGDPITISVSDDRNPFTIRVYDRGWIPVEVDKSLTEVAATNDGVEDIAEINDDALRTLLSTSGIEWTDN